MPEGHGRAAWRMSACCRVMVYLKGLTGRLLLSAQVACLTPGKSAIWLCQVTPSPIQTKENQPNHKMFATVPHHVPVCHLGNVWVTWGTGYFLPSFPAFLFFFMLQKNPENRAGGGRLRARAGRAGRQVGSKLAGWGRWKVLAGSKSKGWKEQWGGERSRAKKVCGGKAGKRGRHKAREGQGRGLGIKGAVVVAGSGRQRRKRSCGEGEAEGLAEERWCSATRG